MILIVLSLIALSFAVASVQAQGECDTAQTINYPIDVNTFQLAQDYGVASPRHQGRFHTGEDWYGGPDSEGTPVRAAAAGRVTYSAPTGWGRDGGVIIIEHTFPDGAVYYTQYGHIFENDLVTFPQRLTCIAAGDVVGVIGDVRPSPHVHFEVRVSSPDIPGPGYSRELPDSEGWRRPAKIVANLQTQLNPAFRWRVNTDTFGPQIPPLVLSDNSLMVIDGGLLRRVTSDGRVLYRVPVARPAVSVTDYQGNPMITYINGILSFVDLDGAPGEFWAVDFSPDMPPLEMDNALIFHTANNDLVALEDNLREIRWTLNDVPRYQRAHVAGSLIALEIDNELWLITHVGELLNRAELQNGASMATMPDGDLLVYTQGGLWQIDETGEWTERIPDAPPGGGSSAVVMTLDGRIYLTDGENLYAYSQTRELSWQANLPQPVTGRADMAYYGAALLIVSNHGNIIAARDSGGFCGFAQIYGNDDASVWHDLGADGVLRVAVGDQIIGLNWEQFANGC
jgi:hypothetical protein